MSTHSRCPRCHADLSPSERPQGLCPKCLLAVAMGEGEVIRTHTGSPAPEPPTPAQLQPHFPGLEIMEIVGRGGMGVVYKARQLGLDRLVALKILDVDTKGDPTFAERFRREARAMAGLNHPNIAGVHDSGHAGGHFYLVMEYVDGPNLRQLIVGGKLESGEALAIVAQISGALEFAHSAGVVHRDIKPENVLVNSQGKVKIVDFGLAKLLGLNTAEPNLTRTHQAMGTWHYMAPEQVERPLEVDHRADIYSLGVVFYELLTGELPLGRFEVPSKKVEVDVRLDEVVLRTLEKDPDRRYQRAGDVQREVRHISSVDAQPPAPALTGNLAFDTARAASREAAENWSRKSFSEQFQETSSSILTTLMWVVFGFGVLFVVRFSGHLNDYVSNLFDNGDRRTDVSTYNWPWPPEEVGLKSASRKTKRAVAEAWARYLVLEERHTHVEPRSSVVMDFEIAPFGDQLEQLESDLELELAGLLEPSDLTAVLDGIRRELLFPYGRENVELELTQVVGGYELRRKNDGVVEDYDFIGGALPWNLSRFGRWLDGTAGAQDD